MAPELSLTQPGCLVVCGDSHTCTHGGIGALGFGLGRSEVIHVLATHVGLVVTHDKLLKEIWTGNQRDNIQYLRILVRKLRQKIETDPNHPRLLITESGVCYRLQSRLENSSAD